MSLSIKLEVASMERQMRELARVTRRTNQAVLDEQARLLVRDCIRLTPPFTPGANFTDSLAAQRRVGVKAVTEQVKQAFGDIRKLEIYTDEKSKGGKYLRLLVRSGRWEEARLFLAKIGIKAPGVWTTATKMAHRAARDKRGRVSRKAFRYLVTNARSIDGLVRSTVKNVGMAKGGWVKAAQGLGLKLPNWITRHSRSGVFVRKTDPNAPAIIVGNVVPYVQQSGADLRIMDRAMANRRRNLGKQVEASLRAAAKKARAT